MTSARPFLRAIIVARADSPPLDGLIAVVDAEKSLGARHLVLLPDSPRPDLDDDRWSVLEISAAATFGEAVAHVLDTTEAQSDETLWLLHDDCLPAPGALGSLATAARRRRRAGVVGAAVTDPQDSRRVVNLGVTASVLGARRVDLVNRDDVYQGQYDDRDDVLAVSLVGALVSRACWETVGTPDPAYAGFGESLDFCRRAWRAGYDVVVVPSARIAHAQRGLRGDDDAVPARVETPAAYRLRRAGEWYHALVWAPRGFLLLIPLAMLASALTRAMYRVASNEYRLVAHEFAAPALALARAPQARAARSAIAGFSTVAERSIRPLVASPREVWEQVRAREWGAYESWRAESAPTEDQRREVTFLARRRRLALGSALFTAALTGGYLTRDWAEALGRGQMLGGTRLGVTDLTVTQLWERTWTGFSQAGFGGDASDGTFSALMLLFAALPGGLASAIGWLLVGAATLACLGAWFAAGTATRSVVVRAAVAVSFALWPPFVGAVMDARVGAVLVHLLLPWWILALVRAVGCQRVDPVATRASRLSAVAGSPSAAAAATVLLGAIGAASPLLLVPLTFATFAVGALAPHRRVRVWATLIPAWILQAPAVIAGASSDAWWSGLTREPGVATTHDAGEPIALALGSISGHLGTTPWPSTVAWLLLVPGAAVLGGSVVALIVAKRTRLPATAWLVAALALATAVVATRTIAQNASAASAARAVGDPAPGQSLMFAALGAAVLMTLAAHHSPQPEPPAAAPDPPHKGTKRSRVRLPSAQGIRYAAALAAVVVALATAIALAVDARTSPDVVVAARDTLPQFLAADQGAPVSHRVLVLDQAEDGTVTYRVLSGDGAVMLDGRAGVPNQNGGADQRMLAAAVANLVGGGEGTSGTLAAWGVGAIVVAPTAIGVEAALERLPEYVIAGAGDKGSTWRVSRPGSEVPPSFAWETSGGQPTRVLPADGAQVDAVIAPGTGDRLVVLATPPSDRWEATLAGVRLAPTDDAGRQAFVLGDSGGRLEIIYRDQTYRAWWLAGVVLMALAAVASVPVRPRALTRGRA